MRHRCIIVSALALAAFVACGQDDATSPAFVATGVDAGVEPATEQGIDAPIGSCQPGECCIEGSRPDLGLRILLKSTSCNVVRGRSIHFDVGIELTRDITVDESARIATRSGRLSSSLTTAATNGASRSTWLELQGALNEDHYCECDHSDNPEPTHFTHVVKASSHFYPFVWTGRRYDGETDTGGTEGPLFAPGPTSLVVSFVIDGNTQLGVTLPFTIVAGP